MSEVATFLKVASTAMLLSVVDNPNLEMPALANPVRAITQVSHDPHSLPRFKHSMARQFER